MAASRRCELPRHGAGANKPSQEPSVELFRVEKPRDETSSGWRGCGWASAGPTPDCLRGHLVPPLRPAPRPPRGALQLRHPLATVQQAPGAGWGLTGRGASLILPCIYCVTHVNNKGDVGKGSLPKLNILDQSEHGRLIPGISHVRPTSMVFKDGCNFRCVSHVLMFCVFK